MGLALGPDTPATASAAAASSRARAAGCDGQRRPIESCPAAEAVLGQPLRAAGSDAPRASGTLEAHYAPRAKLRVMPADQLRAALGVLAKSTVNPVAVYCRSVTADRSVRVSRTMPDDPVAAAHELFASLRELDSTGANLIWVESPPDDPAWDGVRDRLQRAAAA
jgi:L-threonylcarbamoyladenylate synthase